jgi:hypothetical protein
MVVLGMLGGEAAEDRCWSIGVGPEEAGVAQEAPKTSISADRRQALGMR